MSQITLKIQVNENAGTSLNFNTASEINNVSSLLSKETTQNDGVNGISFATSSISLANGFLGNGGQFQSEKDKYNGYMFGATDSDGKFSLKLTLEGDNLDRIVIYFDKNANQFATEAIVDNDKTIYSDDPVWAIDLGEELTTHTIEFIKWNRPNYNACFTMLQVMLEYFELNKNWITNLESLSQTTTNAEDIVYGALASSGNAEVIDNEGYIEDLIADGMLNPSNIPVQIFVNGKLIQEHITTSSSYDTDGNTLSIKFSNEIENFSKLKYRGYNYPEERKSAYDLLYDVMNNYYDGKLSIDSFNNMLSENIIYGSNNTYGPIYNYLKNIFIEYPIIESNKTYVEIINEFCSLAQLQMYLNDDGNLKFTTARPVIHNSEYIFIPPDAISSNFDEDLILANKYDSVESAKQVVKDVIDYASVLTKVDFNINSLDELTEKTYTDSMYNYMDVNNSMTYIKIVAMYYSGEVEFTKSQNQNLEKILTVFGDIIRNDSYVYKNNYTLFTAPVTAIGNPASSMTVSISNMVIKNYEGVYEYDQSSTLDVYAYHNYYYSGVESYAEIKDKNESKIISVVDDGTKITLKFTVLCGKKVYTLSGGNKSSSPTTDASNVPMTGTYEYYEPVYGSGVSAGDISIYGNKRIISFEESQSRLNAVNEPINIASLDGGGKLIQDNTVFSSEKLYEIINNNIISDYKNGIKTAKTILNCKNLYNSNGTLTKNWVNGEIVCVGDVLCFSDKKNKDGSYIYWKVTGRKFIYDGEPLVEVELMECKPVESYTDSGQFGDMKYETFQKSLRELSSQKSIVVSNDYTSLSAGENVSSLEGFLAVPKTVTSLTGDFSSAIGFTGMKFEIPNEISITVPSTIFYLDVDIDKWAEKSFNSAILRGNTYFAKNGQAINNLEINSKYIGDYAFCNYAGTNITLGDSVSDIGVYSFKNSKITSLTIPNSVKTIFREAFNNCYNLSSLKLGNSITELGYGSFMYCSSLTEITIPASVTYINRMSFYGCSSLTKITFENPNGWKSTQTGASIDLSNPAKNVTLLTQTYAEQNIAIF